MDPLSMLRIAGAGLRLLGGSGGSAAPAEGASFDDLLRQAQSGELFTGDPVNIEAGLPLDLTQEQLGRVADACDRAAAAGSKSALVKLDGLLLKVDVASRTITASIEPRLGDVITGIDAVVEASGGDADAAPVVPLPPASMNESLLRALSKARSA